MTTEKKSKVLWWVFKIGGIAVSCLLPVLAIIEKFPIWATSYGAFRSVGVGTVLILMVLTIVFRKSVFPFIMERLNLKHAPPIAVWLAMLIFCYIMIDIGNFLEDLTVALWMGVIGCAVGTLLMFLGEHFFGLKEEQKNE